MTRIIKVTKDRLDIIKRDVEDTRKEFEQNIFQIITGVPYAQGESQGGSTAKRKPKAMTHWIKEESHGEEDRGIR